MKTRLLKRHLLEIYLLEKHFFEKSGHAPTLDARGGFTCFASRGSALCALRNAFTLPANY